jgi:zinc transport system substrate-binding protein
MLFSLSSCVSKTERTSNSKIKVVVSFNAMSEFTKAIGKDKVDVVTIIPNGTEPHNFEPKIKDFENFTDAKLFIYNGLGLEKWANKVATSVDNKNLVEVDASKGYSAIKSSAKGESEYDPHLWISLKGAKYEAKNIEKALEKVDASNKSYYEKNYADFSTKLDNLYKEYNAKFNSCTNKDFVTGHAAFAYLCNDFNLKQDSVEDVFADGEPGTKKMSELISYCKTNNIKTIFVEDMVSPKVSETLAKEVGAKVKKIYTEESKEDNLDYIQSMKTNLEEIYNSLK